METSRVPHTRNAKNHPGPAPFGGTADRYGPGLPSECPFPFTDGPRTHNSRHPGEKWQCPRGPRPPTLTPPARGGAAELAWPGPTHLASCRRRCPPAAGAPRRQPRRAPAPPGARACSSSGASPQFSGAARCGGPGPWGRARPARPEALRPGAGSGPAGMWVVAGTWAPAGTSSARRAATSSVASAPAPLSWAPWPHLRSPETGLQPAGRQEEGGKGPRPKRFHCPQTSRCEAGERTAPWRRGTAAAPAPPLLRRQPPNVLRLGAEPAGLVGNETEFFSRGRYRNGNWKGNLNLS